MKQKARSKKSNRTSQKKKPVLPVEGFEQMFKWADSDAFKAKWAAEGKPSNPYELPPYLDPVFLT